MTASSISILFVGDLNRHTRSFQRRRAFEELGYGVHALSHSPIGAGRDWWIRLKDKIRWKLGRPKDRTDVNQTILRTSTHNDYDVIWIEKGNTIRVDTLREVKSRLSKVRIVSFLEDDMYAQHNRTIFFTECIPEYDWIFTTKSFNCNPEELPSLGAKQVEFVTNSYGRWIHRPHEVTQKERDALGAVVGFIGTYEQERAEILEFLADHEIPIRIWGNGQWSRIAAHPFLHVENRPLYFDSYAKAICATKINLCFLRKINRDRHTARSVEIPACGGFMLAERTDEHCKLFEEDREAVFFDTRQELLKKINYYLDNDEERKAIADAGRRRALESGYSHHDLLKSLVDKVISGSG